MFALKKYTPIKLAFFAAYVVLLFYLIIPAFLWCPLYQTIVLCPFVCDEPAYKKVVAECTIKPEDHYFQNESGDKLHGWLFKKPGAQKLVLMHHGNAGNLSMRYMLANEVTACGASIFLYDYRGFGRSTGIPDLKGVLKDGQSANAYVTQKLGYAPEQVVHYGESIGSGIACEVAANNKSGGLILHSAVGSLPRVGRNVFAFLRPYPDFLFPQPQFDNVNKIRDIHAPVLLFHGMRDKTVSYHDSEAIYENATEPKKLVLLKESDHNNCAGNDFQPFDAELRSFLSGAKERSI